MCERDDPDVTIGKQVLRVRDVVLPRVRIQQVAPSDVSQALTNADETVQTPRDRRDQAEPVVVGRGKQLDGEIVAHHRHQG